MKSDTSPCLAILTLIVALFGVSTSGAPAGPTAGQFCEIERQPDLVSVTTEAGTAMLTHQTGEMWTEANIAVKFHSHANKLTVGLSAPSDAVKWLQIQWNVHPALDWQYLGDAWERAYGDLEWKPLDAGRVMPWYFLASNGTTTHGYGVMTGPSSLCYWTAGESNITLHADVRCGGMGVQLSRRTLEVCTVVSRCGESDESPFAAAQAFCKIMCPHPRLPRQPVYGFNDWYCSYGHDTADKFLEDMAYITSLLPKGGNRPFAVVDDGWQWKGENGGAPGLWNRTNPSFSPTLTMAEFAKRIKALGARPGLWYRPLIANADQPKSWRLQRDPAYLDPTVPEVRELIRANMTRFHAWGYQLVKHDFSTFDLTGRWGNHMGPEVTPDGWSFADRSRTTAEIIRDFYLDIRKAAGNDTVIIGCDTMGHLAAGIFEMQRIGDDTSGNNWSRTRKMGVNCLAFRAPQHGTFFAVDADCAGQTTATSVPWDKNSQWLNLLAHSGTPLFVSFPRDTITPDREPALREALTAASRAQPLAEPLDWQNNRTPEKWLLDQKPAVFSW